MSWNFYFPCKYFNNVTLIFRALEDLIENKSVIFTPWIRHIAPEWCGWNTAKRKLQNVFDFLQKNIDEHEKNLPADEPR